jgi:TetR/AcrR family transcriptional regulator
VARPRSAGYDEQREQILAAAAALFALRGYTATTMNGVAAACGVSKPTLYHYVRDKHDLLAQIARGHVQRLEALVSEVDAAGLAPEARLRELISRFMAAYAGARNEHRVLTEDVRFLEPAARSEVLDGQRRVVDAFASTIGGLRPDLEADALAKPLAMLVFGMMNWTFTWWRSDGAVDSSALAAMVQQLLTGGLPAVQAARGSAGAALRRNAAVDAGVPDVGRRTVPER